MSKFFGGPGIGRSASPFGDAKTVGAVLLLVKGGGEGNSSNSGGAGGNRVGGTVARGSGGSGSSGGSDTAQTKNELARAAKKGLPGGGAGTETVLFLVQNWSMSNAERTQEVVTLGDTEHIYTFGRVLPKLSVTGYFISIKSASDIHTYPSDKILKLWEKSLRAKVGGKSNQPNAIVYIEALGSSLQCVAENLTLGGNVGQEVLVEATLQLTVLDTGKK
jgi:hypothetical protein